jgi:hypothetical protein
VCKTQAQWDEERGQTRRDIQDFTNKSLSTCSSTMGCGG